MLALAWARPASAAPWVRIDRVEAEPSLFEGLTRLQIFATAVDLHGVVLGDLTGKNAWKLRIGNRVVRAPYLLGTFRHVDDELLVAIVVETAAPFADVLPEIKAQLETFLQTLPRTTRLLVVGYDDEVEIQGNRRPMPIARARQALDGLELDPMSVELQLVEAVDQAREALARARPETAGAGQRKLILVISDGKDVDPTPSNYRAVSRRAGTQGIRIHTIGFPADRNRYPLYGLAELSKQSGGTFRLVLTKGGFAGHLEQLAREINDQYVLTYYLPEEQLARKRIQLEARDIVSESARVPRTACGGETCAAGQFCAAMRCVAPAQPDSLGFVGWLMLIAGVVVGLFVAVGLVGLVIGWVHRRRERQAGAATEAPANAPGAAEAQAPAEPAVHRIIPQGPHGQPVAPAHGGYPAGQPGAPASGAHAVLAGRAATSGHEAARAASHPASNPVSGAGVQRIQPSGPSGPMGAIPPAAAPSLLVLSGPHQGQRIPLHHGFLIGTAPGCHLLLAGDRFASGHHAHVLMDAGGGCTLVDRGSTNGTFINGVRMREQRLVHGMLIKVGSTEARFLSQ